MRPFTDSLDIAGFQLADVIREFQLFVLVKSGNAVVRFKESAKEQVAFFFAGEFQTYFMQGLVSRLRR